jgi:hypothetical protein
MVMIADIYRPFTTDRLDPSAITQHEYVIPGRLLIRNDSSIMLSPLLYNSYIKHADSQLLSKIGKGSIHFCGNGKHLIPSLLTIPDLLGLDFGDSKMMNIKEIYLLCLEKKISLTGIAISLDEIENINYRKDFKTGVVLNYFATCLEDAKEAIKKYDRPING